MSQPDGARVVTPTAIVTIQDDDTPSLLIEKRASITRSTRPTQVEYTLIVTNNNGITVTNLFITDTVPPGATYLSGGTVLTNPSDNVAWSVANLGAGQGVQVRFIVTASQTITNQHYRATADSGLVAVGQIPIVTTINEEVLLFPQLTISKHGPTRVRLGEHITYTLTITNQGVMTATNLHIRDQLPNRAHYITGGTLVDGVAQWTIATLPPGDVIKVVWVITATETLTSADYSVTADGNLHLQRTEAITTWVIGNPVLALLTPINGVILETARPTFQWQVTDSGWTIDYYRFEVESDVSAQMLITMTQTSYTPSVDWDDGAR
ncbi:MAG: DUF11 domain-containing protein, partial [Okeania sp. SIO3B3]|nr:DUF11 domain-containing protein [Okeania sp. SIO3B3]